MQPYFFFFAPVLGRKSCLFLMLIFFVGVPDMMIGLRFISVPVFALNLYWALLKTK